MGTLAKIRRLHLREGVPIKEIERRTGIARNTMERCRDLMPKPCMAVLQPDGVRFLADCFGHMHVGFCYPGFSYDEQLPVRVRAALEQAKQN